jgi:hypothetical protein
MPKVGFRFQGFGSTSITAAIPNSQTIRPLPTHLDKKIHPRDWTFSPKPEVVSAIKKTDGTNLKPKPFKANPVPRCHYNEPYPPVWIAKKNKTELARNMNKKTLEPTTPGLVSRVWHSVIEPILHPHNDASTEKVITELPLEPEKKESAKDHQKLADETVEPMAANADLPDHPGLASRMWHSVVDPILHPHNEASTEKVPLPSKKKNLDNFMSNKHFRATPAPPSTQKPSIPVVPPKRLPIRNVKSMKHLDPAEKAELQEFELTEKAILQQVDAQKEMTPSRSLKKIRPGEDVVHQAKSLKSLEITLQKNITSEPEKKESATVDSHPILPAETVEESMAANADDLPDHPGLASRMWHSLVDPILHPNKKLEPDEKSIAGNDEEKPDENQSDVQDEVKVDEDPEAPEAEPSEKSDLDGEMPSVPEAAHVQKITKEIVTVAAVPDENEMAPNPEAVLDPIREAVEISPFTRTVASRMETEAAGTHQKIRRRRHDKRHRHSESHPPRPKHSEVKPEKPKEPVRPGLLRRAVAGLGSTAWSAGKSVLTGVGSVIGLTGRNKTPIGITEEPAAKTNKKHNRHHKKKSHQRPAGKVLEVTAVPKL